MSLLKVEIRAALNPGIMLKGVTANEKAVDTMSGISQMVIDDPMCPVIQESHALLTIFFQRSVETKI